MTNNSDGVDRRALFSGMAVSTLEGALTSAAQAVRRPHRAIAVVRCVDPPVGDRGSTVTPARLADERDIGLSFGVAGGRCHLPAGGLLACCVFSAT